MPWRISAPSTLALPRSSIPILNQANPPLAMISPANTNVGLTKPFNPGEPEVYYPTGKRNYMRVVTADDIQGSVGAKWAKSLGARNVYILDDQQVYGKGLADVFEKTSKDIGLNVLGRDGIDGKAADYKALAAKIKATNPQLIYYGGITQNNAGQLLKDLRAAGIRALFMGADGILEKAFVEAAGADVANGALATIAGTPKAKLPAAGKKFYTDYQAKYKSAPEAVCHLRLRSRQRGVEHHQQGVRQGPPGRPGCHDWHQGLQGRARHLVVHPHRRHDSVRHAGQPHRQGRVEGNRAAEIPVN